MQNFIAQVISPFVAPALAWAGVAMVSVPVAIHLLSRWRRKPQPWGAMRFLLEAYRKQKQRMRFEQWLLLLLRCLIVLLLGLALARPLMVGALGAVLGGLDNRGRVINLVIDDAMSLRATDPRAGLNPDTEPATRFSRLIDQADSVLDALEPGDRVTLWRSGRPARAVIAEPTQDHSRVRRALSELEPGYSRPDMPDALSRIRDAADTRQQDTAPTVTFLFSDFARSSDYIDQAMDPVTISEADTRAWVVARPWPGLRNIQVTSIKPRRRVVWIDGSSGQGIAAQVTVTRYAEDLTETSLGMTVGLVDAEGLTLASVRRAVAFTNGQREVTLGIDLPVASSSPWLDTEGGVLLGLRAQLETDPADLSADNQTCAAVEVRRRMRVALIDEPDGPAADGGAGLTPGQWVRLALNPSLAGAAGSIQTTRYTPTQLNDPEVLRSVDAVVLIRPDRLIRPSWRTLGSYVRSGGLVWVFTPSVEGSSPWVTMMSEVFEPGWRIGLEALDAPDGTSWTLDNSALNAEPLERLSADWQALIRPIGVHRLLPLETEPSDAWMTLRGVSHVEGEDASTEQSRRVLLAHRRVGRGSLMLMTTAVDTRWTNLPTKPLFVPLIHETLHGVLGLREQPGVVFATSGDLPTLEDAWSGVSVLQRLGTDSPTGRIDVNPVEAGHVPAEPLGAPGVYQSHTDDGPRWLIVNPDPRAGDTRPINEEAMTHWLDSLGAWQWMDEDDPGAVLQAQTDTADIGWALLWVVLALVLTETVLARYFSHAGAGPSASLTGHVWQAVVRLRSGEKPGESSGRAA